MTDAEAVALGVSLAAAAKMGVRPSRLAALLMDAAHIESRGDEDLSAAQESLIRRRGRGQDWRSDALDWLRAQPECSGTAREYAAHAGIRRPAAYARMLALLDDALVEQLGRGRFKAL